MTLFEKFKYLQSIYSVMKLTSQEKMVLYGLTRYPELSLKELSKVLGINYWSVYKIQDKFRRKRIIKEVVIPNYRALGFELLVAGYGSLTQNRIKEITRLEKMIKREGSISCSGMFLAFAEAYRGFTLGVVKNYTEIVKNILYVDRMAGIRELMVRESSKMVLMPLEITKMPIFFDYSRLLAREFGMPYENGKRKRKPEGSLTQDEIRVLTEFTKDPERRIKDIAMELNMSRAKVAKIKEKLFGEGWCIPRVIPDMRALGYEVIVFAHWESNPMGIIKIERNIKNLDIDLSRVIFLAYNPLEGIVIALFKSLGESREIISLFSKFVERENVLIREPDILFLSLEEGKEIKSHEHHPILSSLL